MCGSYAVDASRGLISPDSNVQEADSGRIRYCSKCESFKIVGAWYKISELMQVIVNAWKQQTKQIELGPDLTIIKVSLTPNYIVSMIKFACQYGWFIDDVEGASELCDHEFDQNVPTPGQRWGEVCRLRKEIAGVTICLRQCKNVRPGHQDYFDGLRQRIEHLSGEIDRILSTEESSSLNRKSS